GSIGPAVRNAAWRAARELCKAASPLLGAKPEELKLSGGRVVVSSNPSAAVPLRKAAAQLPLDVLAVGGTREKDYGEGGKPAPPSGIGGVQFVQVAVDTETGIVKVERVVAVHDCGRPMNPLAMQSQVNGGILQGLSYALYEERVMDA